MTEKIILDQSPQVNLAELDSLLPKLDSILEYFSRDFFQPKTSHLPEIRALNNELGEKLTRVADISQRSEVVECIKNIKLNLEILTKSINKKLTRRVLSRWAVEEVTNLINKTRECILYLDLQISCADEAHLNNLRQESQKCIETCQAYHKKNQERLLEGTCYLESCKIYEPLLHSFTEIFTHINICAEKINNRPLRTG